MSTLRPGVDIFATPGSHRLDPAARAHEYVHPQAWGGHFHDAWESQARPSCQGSLKCPPSSLGWTFSWRLGVTALAQLPGHPKMSTLRPGVDIFVTPGSHSLGPTARAHENVHLQAWPPSATQFAKYCWGMGLPRSVFDGAKFATLLEKTSTWQCYVAMFC